MLGSISGHDVHAQILEYRMHKNCVWTIRAKNIIDFDAGSDVKGCPVEALNEKSTRDLRDGVAVDNN